MEGTMIDLLKKVMFTGLGVASLTKDTLEELVQDFVNKGKLSEQEGKKFVDELLVRSNESKEAIRAQIDERVQFALQKMNIARSSEIDELKAQIQELRKAFDEKEQNND
jgi:polyhydroxyalkanoate synthesis regulator phasin